MKVLVTQSCPALCNLMGCSPPGSSVHGILSPSRNTGMVCHFLLQGIFPTQGSNPHLQHCRRILYHLSHQGSPYHNLNTKQITDISKDFQKSLGTILWLFGVQFKQNPKLPDFFQKQSLAPSCGTSHNWENKSFQMMTFVPGMVKYSISGTNK